MRKFIISGKVEVSMHTLIEAETEVDAVRIAQKRERSIFPLCWHCASVNENLYWVPTSWACEEMDYINDEAEHVS